MSVQIASLAPATRVASRKLGPVAGSGSCWSASASAAWLTSTLATTCGRCETLAIRRSWTTGSIAVGWAPSPATKRWSRSYRIPDVRSVGVRYQVAPAKRSARAWSTPDVSAPASGWPPTKRGSSRPATISRLVEPTSETTHSGPATASAASTVSGSAPTGAATNTRSASHTASARDSAGASIAPRSRAASSTPGAGSHPVTRACARSRAASPMEPPISPTPTTATTTQVAARRARTAAASSSRTPTVVSHDMQASVIDWP